MKFALFACLAAFALGVMCNLAGATTYSSDATDLWWNPTESGWGVNVVQQDDTLFATLFAYGASSQPAWYVGPAIAYVSTNSAGGLVFSGPWYQTTGPWFGGAFNPSNVTVRQVGNATFTLNSLESATLTYTVDNVSVTKNLLRQTWKSENLTGVYIGVSTSTLSGCGAGVDGYSEGSTTISITQNGTAMTIVDGTGSDACTYTGTYSQSGRMGSINATGTCGTLNFLEVQTTFDGLTARARFQQGNCTGNLRLGALRR